MAFWIALQYGTARTAGLLDQKFFEFESGQFNFPADVPDCEAGRREFRDEQFSLKVFAYPFCLELCNNLFYSRALEANLFIKR